ncbi:hypothetical protein ABIA32_000355 [Streptacidiphilus sp. MAP12-20]|uniref:relaxase/mobilization nuclease domain-containing protein n=1 Tax=Streptacidiphilus sp. MAP12-20 TaxID=3156299 RepID=UPI003515C9BA
MVPDVSTGDRSRGLLSYLFGPGRRDEHTDPHIVAAFAMPGLVDPGRVPLDQHQATLTDLADYLDQPVRLREQRLGKKVPQHVWHCPVRTAPGDRYLTDEEWAEVARRIVHATGIAEHGDDAACRWIAVRHAEDHIHIMATSVREDGRRPRNKGDGRRAQAECRRIEEELGLRRLKSGDGTAPKTPTSAERAKAERQGRKNTARVWLREHAYAAAAAAQGEEEFFAVLTALGMKVRPRLGPVTGEVTGYSLAAPGDTNSAGEPIFYGGSSLAPDLSLNRLRERFTPTQKQEGEQTGRAVRADRVDAGSTWRRADTELRTAFALVAQAAEGTAGEQLDAQVQAQAAAFAELLHNTAAAAPRQLRAELCAAATAFGRTNRSAIRAEHRAADALRQAGRALLTVPGSKDGDFVTAALVSAVFLLIALGEWHTQRGHQQQAAAAHQSLAHLRTAQQQAAQPRLAQLTDRTPNRQEADRLAAVVQTVVPEQAQRILTDPAWPALATTLAQAESAGTPAHRALADLTGQRELATADRPAEVLLWRLRNHTADQINRRTNAATHRSAARRPPTTPGLGVVPAQPRPTDTEHRRRTR